ncbi:hypothetical protein LTR86_009684 [Recurvomyces mirabilis]|nr:hypothetical protein LTR86_009684 [Recurvomyces mirabilis]
MFYKTIIQYAQALRNLEHWLNIAQQHADAKQTDMTALLEARLAPDQANLIYQVTSACDYAKEAAALLAGRIPPKHADAETTIAEVRERIAKTVAYIETVQESDYDGAAKRPITVSWSPPDAVMYGEDYPVQVSTPNVYFHLMVAYEILRHHGVDLGKMDYCGPIRTASNVTSTGQREIIERACVRQDFFTKYETT